MLMKPYCLCFQKETEILDKNQKHNTKINKQKPVVQQEQNMLKVKLEKVQQAKKVSLLVGSHLHLCRQLYTFQYSNCYINVMLQRRLRVSKIICKTICQLQCKNESEWLMQSH